MSARRRSGDFNNNIVVEEAEDKFEAIKLRGLRNVETYNLFRCCSI